jgi:hypothetical protein
MAALTGWAATNPLIVCGIVPLRIDWVSGVALSGGRRKGRGEAERATVGLGSQMDRYTERSAMWGGGHEECGWRRGSKWCSDHAVIFSWRLGVVTQSVAVCSGFWLTDNIHHWNHVRRSIFSFGRYCRMGLSRSFYISIEKRWRMQSTPQLHFNSEILYIDYYKIY